MTEPTELAKLRHLYQNMVNGAVRDTASAKRIAEGLLAPAIAALERGTLQPTHAADSVLEDAARLDWLDQNIFHREMDEWDAKYGGRGDCTMWAIFAPKGHQGSARNIIDAARKQGDT